MGEGYPPLARQSPDATSRWEILRSADSSKGPRKNLTLGAGPPFCVPVEGDPLLDWESKRPHRLLVSCRLTVVIVRPRVFDR